MQWQQRVASQTLTKVPTATRRTTCALYFGKQHHGEHCVKPAALIRTTQRKLFISPTSRSITSSDYNIDHYNYSNDMDRSKNPGADLKQKALYELRHTLGLTSMVNADEDLQDAVFVAIDCEAFESNHKHTTEVGVSVLDTRAIKTVPPGEHAEAWIEKIQHAHYRVIEYSHEINYKFVKGCPDSFDFGPTIWIRRADTAQILTRIFRSPTHLPLSADLEQLVSPPEDEKDPTPNPETRKIILVTHSGRHDIDYLRNLDFDLNDANLVPNLLRRLDTQWLVSPKRTPTNLANLLRFLGIPAEHLHNAGNDAAYILRALLVIALREQAEPGSVAVGLRGEVLAIAARAMAAAAGVATTTTTE